MHDLLPTLIQWIRTCRFNILFYLLVNLLVFFSFWLFFYPQTCRPTAFITGSSSGSLRVFWLTRCSPAWF
jgi:hypothetical protein